MKATAARPVMTSMYRSTALQRLLRTMLYIMHTTALLDVYGMQRAGVGSR